MPMASDIISFLCESKVITYHLDYTSDPINVNGAKQHNPIEGFEEIGGQMNLAVITEKQQPIAATIA
jgi:hypothetical protein